MVVLPNERELLERRLLELDAQLDNIDVLQNYSPLLERAQQRITLCREYIAITNRLSDLRASEPEIPLRKNPDFMIRGRTRLKWDEAIEQALLECSRPLDMEEIAQVIAHNGWMRESNPVNESTVRSALDRYRAKLGVIKIKESSRCTKYWLTRRGPPPENGALR